MRIAHYLASCGVASRRASENIILQGRVKINNTIVSVLSQKITETDIVSVDNKILYQEKPQLWLYYKPSGLVVSHRDEFNRETIFDNLKVHLKINHIISIGRLDLNSEGLMLITNSGLVANHFENPKNEYKRVYHVRSYGFFNIKRMQMQLEQGILIDNIQYGSIQIKQLDSKIQTNNWFEIILTEGKNREIRKIFQYFNLEVNKLIRVQYGKYHLNNMQKEDIIKVNNFSEQDL